jgi:cell wall-associated NlpC family hydrolase
MREYLVNLALKLVGCPYIWGGVNPWTGLDCSGLVIWIYQVFGLLPSGDWTAQGLYDHFASIPGTFSGPTRTGDLVFYGRDEEHVTHVMLRLTAMLVVGASGGGHLTHTFEDARKAGAQVKVKPIDYRADRVATVHVKFPGEA